MRINEGGFSTPLAMSVIFSLSVITMSFSMLVAANEKKIDSYRKIVKARKEADSIIKEIGNEIQVLKEYSCDSDDDSILLSLIGSVCKYAFSVKDVSTGINKSFMSEKFYDSEPMKEYVSACQPSVFTEYGWINPKYADRDLLDGVAADFGSENLFPLVNSFPLLNAFNMDEAFVKAALESCGIKKADEKTRKLKECLSSETSIKDLSEVLGVEEGHPVLDLIGIKTAFWEVRFDTEKCSVSAVFAAVPDAEDQRSVEKYMLVRKNISYKGEPVYE